MWIFMQNKYFYLIQMCNIHTEYAFAAFYLRLYNTICWKTLIRICLELYKYIYIRECDKRVSERVRENAQLWISIDIKWSVS